jgi:hypothetical protein
LFDASTGAGQSYGRLTGFGFWACRGCVTRQGARMVVRQAEKKVRNTTADSAAESSLP